MHLRTIPKLLDNIEMLLSRKHISTLFLLHALFVTLNRVILLPSCIRYLLPLCQSQLRRGGMQLSLSNVRKCISIDSYLYVSCSGSITSVGEERLICHLSFTCNYEVSVWRRFLFLWVIGMGCVILLWHSLSLPYNYFGVSDKV